MLLQEIHHRVKNNLHIVKSILKIQSTKIKDEEIQNIFNECENRIMSISLLHEKLYRSEDLSKINFNEYLDSLIKELLYNYGIAERNIEKKINIENVELDIDTAQPCGLIVNELVTNSFKYAFPKGRKGELVIDFYSKNNKYNLVVGDNGIGIPDKIDFTKTDTLGLQLVNNLIKQLGGSIELDTSSGTLFKMSFPKKG